MILEIGDNVGFNANVFVIRICNFCELLSLFVMELFYDILYFIMF